uniref:Uncharacterized protein n=2 Tax=Cucumis melo TaxID=3656 RepID=A0A9I9CVW5_CUCME
MAMNTNNTLCLVSAMDRLWYHQIILCSDPFTSHFPNFLNSTSSFPFTNFVPSSPLSPLMDQTIDLVPSSSSSSSDNISLVSQEDYNNEEDKDKQDAKRESSEDQSLNNLKFSVGRKLNKSTSCKSLGELELEEVKGFMDLGFEFKRESLSPQMVKLVPGLQRLRTQTNKQNLEEDDDGDGDDHQENDDDDDDDDDKKREIARPYLSEAWIIRRPNSPLLNLRMPKVSSTSDMKKHLRSWAKTVAFEIQ